MIIDLLNAILVIKYALIRKGKCYMTYKLTDSVVKAIETSQAYKNSTHTSCSTVEFQGQLQLILGLRRTIATLIIS